MRIVVGPPRPPYKSRLNNQLQLHVPAQMLHSMADIKLSTPTLFVDHLASRTHTDHFTSIVSIQCFGLHVKSRCAQNLRPHSYGSSIAAHARRHRQRRPQHRANIGATLQPLMRQMSRSFSIVALAVFHSRRLITLLY